jgi:hypothetical protein
MFSLNSGAPEWTLIPVFGQDGLTGVASRMYAGRTLHRWSGSVTPARP